jgi:hypothetical protein
MRGARWLIGPLAALGALVAAPVPAGATTPPPTPPPATTTSTTVPGAPTTTVAGAPAPPTTAVVPVATPPRAGSAIGGLDRRDDETWSVRRVATATLLGIAALAIIGHVYGRIQSIEPRVGRSIARTPRSPAT